ncbi:MAG: hypothetical protein P3T54_09290 [Dehalogenimonas sp.]|uniref:Zinc ribbon domain-containing protein n=1 Tax=Candidatus Dehalogenimonas loeffleri TaxID=3127115 RepID=A0ABZ2J9A6_9CHLR|nr:hypothetical protein [Dehalogenimonas sp.]
MIIALAILMALAVFVAVVYPFFRVSGVKEKLVRTGSVKEVHYQRDHTYVLLKELETDYQSGTLSREDYEELESKYRNRAVSILKDLDNIQSESNEGLRSLEADIEQQIGRLRKAKGRFCAYCGAQQDLDTLFCPDCGKRLKTKG